MRNNKQHRNDRLTLIYCKMISIIICSTHKEIDNHLEKNVHTTIGDVVYEFVWIDNSDNKYTICQAYNEGVKRARYPYLCFMHDDIVFYSQDWGTIAINAMSNSTIGLLGVQGCTYFDESTLYWTMSGFKKANTILPFQSDKIREDDYPIHGNDLVMVDGMWMFMRRDLFNEIHWDEHTYHGFHMYDMDLCMQINQKGMTIRLLDELWIQHNSYGNWNTDFFQGCRDFHTKWDANLPVSVMHITEDVQKRARRAAMSAICKYGVEFAKSQRRLSWWPYKVATKVCLFLGKEIW